MNLKRWAGKINGSSIFSKGRNNVHKSIIFLGVIGLLSPGVSFVRAQDTDLNDIFHQTMQAVAEQKLTSQQGDAILAELQRLDAQVQEVATIRDLAEQSLARNKDELSEGHQAAAAQKVKDLQAQAKLTQDQAANYAMLLLQSNLAGQSTNQSKFLQDKSAQAYATAKELSQIIADPNQKSWSANFFKIAGDTAQNIKQQFSPSEIKQLFKAGYSDDHPYIKKAYDIILGEKTADLLVNGSTDQIKSAVKRYGQRLKDDITFTNRQFASLNEITNQLANDEKVITQQPQKESAWKAWLGRDGVVAEKAREAVAYLAGIKAEVDLLPKSPLLPPAMASMAQNVQDWVSSFTSLTKEQWQQLGKEEKEMLTSSWQQMKARLKEDHDYRTDYYADNFLELHAFLKAQKDKAQAKAKDIVAKTKEAVADTKEYYVERWQELNDLVKQMQDKVSDKIKREHQRSKDSHETITDYYADRLLELNTALKDIKKKMQDKLAYMKEHNRDSHNVVTDYYADRLLELNASLLQMQNQIKAKIANFRQAAQENHATNTDYYAENFLELNDYLQESMQKVQRKVGQIRQDLADQHELITDYYADNFLEMYDALPDWMKKDFALAQELGWQGSLKKLLELTKLKATQKEQQLKAELKQQMADLKSFLLPHLGNGDSEAVAISLLHRPAAQMILAAQQKAQQEACWERWIKLAVPRAKKFIPLEVTEVSRQMSCNLKMHDLSQVLKQLQKQQDADEILLNTFGISCDSVEREQRFCQIQNSLQEQNNALDNNVSGWQRWTAKIKQAIKPSEAQQLQTALHQSFSKLCGVEMLCSGRQDYLSSAATSERAIVDDPRMAHPKAQFTAGPKRGNSALQR